MAFFDNTRKPTGMGGKIMVSMMNFGHRALVDWGFRFLPLKTSANVLDCGCGGRANLRKLNAKAIEEGRCRVFEGSIAELPFSEAQFDVVTAFETVYFWPGTPVGRRISTLPLPTKTSSALRSKKRVPDPTTPFDVIAGIFDESMLNYRQCAGTELCRVPLCCAVSANHRLAKKRRLTIQDLYGENLLLMHRGWSHYIDSLRDDLWSNHHNIHIVDFEFYSLEIFNRCENSNDILIAIENWKPVHPLLKILPVDWNYTIPFGILHAPEPSKTVQRFLLLWSYNQISSINFRVYTA